MIKISNTELKQEDFIELKEIHPEDHNFLQQKIIERKIKVILKEIESKKKTIATSKKVIAFEKNSIIESESEISKLEKKYSDLIGEKLEYQLNQNPQIRQNNLSEFSTNKIIETPKRQKGNSMIDVLCECQRRELDLEVTIDPIIKRPCCDGYSEKTFSRRRNEKYTNIN